MSAMEKMLSGMIGVTPEQMREMAERMQTGMIELASAVKRTEDNSIKILAILEQENGPRKQLGNDGDSGSSNGD